MDLVRSSFGIKNYQAENLNFIVKLEQGNSDVPDYTRKFTDDYHSFWKSEISEKTGTYLYIMGLHSEPLERRLNVYLLFRVFQFFIRTPISRC